MQQTETITQYVGKNTSIESYCISIAFFRPTTDSNDVFVNDVPIEAGQTLTIAQNEGDLDTTRYKINFGSAVGSTNELYVIRIVPKNLPQGLFVN
jgi:hypothetical protein